MSATTAREAMNDAIGSVEHVEAKLAIARRNGAPSSTIESLQTRLQAKVDQMNLLWDAWNDAMLSERIARIYA